MTVSTSRIVAARRPRAFVGVAGVEAAAYLDRMVSNDVAGLRPGEACDALLLTPKARVLAPLRVLRRGEDDFLLLTEPELGELVRDHLVRLRFAAKARIELEHHESHVLLGPEASAPPGASAIPTGDYGPLGLEVVGAPVPAEAELLDEAELERMRIRAGTPRFGREIDERVLPAEAGLVERAVSFTKGCYPGQEPIARLHYRGHVNRELRVLRIEAAIPPPAGAEVVHGGKSAGRVTSAVPDDGAVVALAFVRTEVPADAVLAVEGAEATMAPLARP